MGRLFVTGDKHGEFNDLYRVCQKTQMEPDDWLVILGDFGFIWNGAYVQNLQKIKRMTKGNIFVVLGNHENYDIIYQFPIEYIPELEAPAYHLPETNVYIALPNQGLYTICGKRCFVVNGADSTDKGLRTEGKSWWPEERLSILYKIDLAETAAKYPEVDYVFSHCTSATVKDMLWGWFGGENSNMEYFLDNIYRTLEFKGAYFGHYHYPKSEGKFHCLYDDIIMLED